MIKEGSFVVYTMKNELGLVKRITDDGCFVWYHMGGTAAKSPFHIIEPIYPHQVLQNTFSNEYAKKSLIERRLRMLTGGDVSDLIDDDDIRRNLLFEFKKISEYQSTIGL